MNETSKKSSRANSTVTHNITFSQALEAGLTHSNLLVGPQTDLSGQGAVLASHSVPLERAKAQQTRDTYGLLFGGSSPSADLQSSLESKLRALLEGTGSVEYVLTWKSWDMQWGPQICAVRASAHRKGDNDYGGWATPDASVMNYGANLEKHLTRIKKIKEKGINGNGAGMPLGVQCKLVGWPTPSVRDYKGGYQGGRIRDGKLSTDALDITAQLITGWPTPQTPRAHSSDRSVGDPKHIMNQLEPHNLGPLPNGYTVEMASTEGFRLNPHFSLWLQGYPVQWACSKAQEIL
tara:strand:+ start:9267 stop:10142 length:876 start_codon:yes stop_codon:yes gene_type:complete